MQRKSNDQNSDAQPVTTIVDKSTVHFKFQIINNRTNRHSD